MPGTPAFRSLPVAVPRVVASAVAGAVAGVVVGALGACAAPAPPADAELARATAGYRPVERDGRRVWCREERATGVLLPRTRCLSGEQLLEQDRAARRVRDRLANPDACPTAGCGPKDP